MKLSLRARLLVTITGLLALFSIGAGLAIRAELHGYLTNRLDSQLVEAGGRNSHAAGSQMPRGGGGGGDDDDSPPYLLAPGQADGTLGASIVGGSVTAAGVLATNDGSTSPADLSDAAKRTLVAVPADGKPHTRTLDGLGSYRLLAQQRPDNAILVTGLPMSGVDATISRLTLVGGFIAGGLILVAVVIAGGLIRFALRPLRRIAATAGRVSELPLHVGEVELTHRVPESQTDVRTEVGQVGAALNRMLDHVDGALRARQASEMQVRQFVADASHELRTPLASIRGYAELCRRTGSDVPPDVAYALQRVESESTRMAGLVDDLLLLARLDAGRPLAQDSVDLAAMLVDAMSDAHAAGGDHVWRLDLPDEPLIVLGDEQRLHQVIVNLLSNARVHTPAGTIVSAALQPAGGGGGTVRLTVVDDGPGIQADLVPHVFERFARGDSSRSRVAGSSGLGLAIAQAVVTAHGGTIDVTSVPGRTEFALCLPRAVGTYEPESARVHASAVAP
jgi:two-component system OmpR family sensor kinase